MASTAIKDTLETINSRRDRYALLAQYYAGQHRMSYATEKFRSAFGRLFATFAANMCKPVVNGIANKLQVTGFASENSDDPQTDAFGLAAWEIWKANRMDRRAGEVHREGLVAGDAYLIVWPEDGFGPRLYPNKAASVCVTYDTERPGTILSAGKVWFDNERRWRMNLYYPDRIEKYATMVQSKESGASFPENATTFSEFTPPGESWPLENPWDVVPVFHFANDADTGSVGVSELACVLPLQDGLNKSIMDMLVAGEFSSLPQRWATGVEIEIDPVTGQPVEFKAGADRVWHTPAADARFGQFDPAGLSPFLDMGNMFRRDIATVSETPLHALSLQEGEYPSGEALKTAEEPLTTKIGDRQVAWGDVWEDAMSLALRMAGIEGAKLECLWRDPVPRNTKSHIETLTLKKGIGVSNKQLQREAGYSEQQIVTMEEEKTAQAEEMGAALLTAFDRNAATPVRGAPSDTEQQTRK